MAALLVLFFGMWLYIAPYDGLNHDAQGYAAQSIAAVEPEPLASDIFLLYRSQDEFTVFSSLYGHWIGWLGLDVAAATATLAFQFLWYLAAWLLMKRALDERLALLGLGLLLTLPCVYGGLRVFHLAEPFFTARTPAEVLSLLGIWAWLGKRRFLALAFLATALAVHPLIAFPALLVIAMSAAAVRWGWRAPAALAAIGCILAVGGAWLLGGDDPLMQGRWLAVTRMRSRFLFVDQWHMIDWNFLLQSVLTVTIGALILRESRISGVMIAAGWLSIAGLALSWLYSAIAPLNVLIQGQPWRWVWPARFLAIAALPAIFLALWRRGGTDRAAALFLASGWLFVVPLTTRSDAVMTISSVLLALSLGLITARNRVSPAFATATVRSAWVVLGTVLLASAATASLAWHMATSAGLSGGGWFGHIANVFRTITPSALLLTIAGILALYRWTPWRAAAVALTACGLIVTAGPPAAKAWAARPYTGPDHSEFADWRQLIPSDAEVLWWERLRETWFLLERRAYLTRSQSGGVVFSEHLADEIARRALVLEPLIVPSFWLGVQARSDTVPNELTLDRLLDVCRDPELGFVIWDRDLGLGAPHKAWPANGPTWYLYDCRKVHEAANNGA